MRSRTRIWVAVGAGLLLAPQAAAVVAAAPMSFEVSRIEIGNVRSFETVRLDGCSSLSDVSEPELPVRVLRFVIPGDARVEDVLFEFEEEELPGEHRVMPAQPEVPVGKTAPWVEPDASIYGSDALYPTSRVRYLGEGYLGGYRIASVAVYPLTYAPESGRLFLATEISVELVLGDGADRSRPRRRVTSGSAELYHDLVASLVENPRDVCEMPGTAVVAEEVVAGGFAPRHTPSLEGSAVEYVIVTNDDLAPYFQDLADWKTKKGVPAVVRTVSWVNANYPGGCDAAERIRMFIQDAYTSWGTTYVLLGGDTDVVPIRYGHTDYYDGDDIPTDLYYSDLDGNWNGDGDAIFGEAYKSEVDIGDSLDLYPDVFVGRAPVNNTVEMDAFLDKTEAYEKTPVPFVTDRNLYLAEVVFPYDWEGGTYSLDGAADINEPAITHVPAWIHNVKLYQNNGEFPESYPLSAPAATDSLELGYNIVVHVGHGNKDIIRVSKNDYLTMVGISMLDNGIDRSSFVWLLNCTTAAVDYDCIAERFMNNPDGGSAALFGPTRYAFPATFGTYLKDWFDILYNEGTTRTGPLCAGAKAQHASHGESGADNADRWTQFTTLLLGDPELSLWTGRPATLTVGHPANMQVGDSGMTVTVTDPAIVEGALVCVQKADDVYVRQTTGPTGQVVLDFVPHTTGTLDVTVSAPGYIPYESTASVLAASDAHVFMQSWSVDDDDGAGSDGNDNGLAEAGETIELDIVMKNSGVLLADDVTVTMTTSDIYAVIEDGTQSIGDIGPGSTVFENRAFRFFATGETPNEHDFEFTVEASEAGRLVWSEEYVCRIYRPDLRQLYVDLDDSSGNGNGIPEAGEAVAVTFEILNEGNGDADAVTGKLRYSGVAVTVTDSIDAWGDVGAGSAVVGTGGFHFTVNGGITEDFRFLLTDDRGHSWTSIVDFVKPGVPDSLSGRVKGTTINLSWGLVGSPDLWGYDIYRAFDIGGPYQRVNTAVVERIAYFSDAGLDENTLYHYYAVAVDSSGNVGANSVVLPISTNPPSQAGWPLATSGGMYPSAGYADIDGDGGLEIVIASEQLYAWNADGSEVHDGDGDPRTAGIFSAEGQGGYRASQAIGEIDGDSGLEIVAAAFANVGGDISPAYEVFAWNGEDGTVLPGWPVTTKKFCWASPVLADLDHDGRSEIILPCADGNLYCWRYNGSEYIDGDDDPLTIGVFADLVAAWDYGSPAVADLDGDRELEIVQPSTSDSVYAFHSDGSRVEGWPVDVQGDAFTSPAIGDVDYDGDLEVAVSSNASTVWLLERDGTVMSGWPQSIALSGDFPPSPVLADVTGDGYLEIVLVGSDGTVMIKDYLGSTLPGWPKAMGSNSHSSPAVADIDGDPDMEIVVGCNDGKVHCFDLDGTTLDGWPIQTDAGIYGSPLVVDIDEDGDVEVILGGMDTNVYVWDCAGDYQDGDGVEWGCFLHDSWRTQFYGFDVPVGIPDDDAGAWDELSRPVLEQNAPNPFNPVTRIAFIVPDAGGGALPVLLSVYGVDGREIATLVDEPLAGGRYAAVWDGRDAGGEAVASGVYFCRLSVADERSTRKMVLLK